MDSRMQIYYFLLVTARKNNTKMASVEEGIIMSANGLSSVNACSKFSYIKKTPNRENAVIAYNNLF